MHRLSRTAPAAWSERRRLRNTRCGRHGRGRTDRRRRRRPRRVGWCRSGHGWRAVVNRPIELGSGMRARYSGTLVGTCINNQPCRGFGERDEREPCTAPASPDGRAAPKRSGATCSRRRASRSGSPVQAGRRRSDAAGIDVHRRACTTCVARRRKHFTLRGPGSRRVGVAPGAPDTSGAPAMLPKRLMCWAVMSRAWGDHACPAPRPARFAPSPRSQMSAVSVTKS
jgi:hypothetical protein